MKKQTKGKIILGTLAGVACLGIGYAALSNITLTINGSATVSQKYTDDDFDVHFLTYQIGEDIPTGFEFITLETDRSGSTEGSGANVVSNNYTKASTSISETAYTGEINYVTGTSASFSLAGMYGPKGGNTGDVAVMRFPIKNTSTDLSANLTFTANPTDSTYDDYFTISTDTQSCLGVVGGCSQHILGPGESDVIVVTVRATGSENFSDTEINSFELTYTAEPFFE